jgi:hypothetical protein
MARRRALKDTVKDPTVKKETAVNRRENPNPVSRKAAYKIVISLLLGFAGGLLTGRFLKI